MVYFIFKIKRLLAVNPHEGLELPRIHRELTISKIFHWSKKKMQVLLLIVKDQVELVRCASYSWY